MKSSPTVYLADKIVCQTDTSTRQTRLYYRLNRLRDRRNRPQYRQNRLPNRPITYKNYQLQTEGWTVKWMTAREYLAAIKAEFEIPGEEGVTDAGIREANLLVLDDVGAEDPTDYNNNKLADLIGTRHQRLAPIIVTTNTSLNATRLDRRTQSRLYELCEQIELTGKDQRI